MITYNVTLALTDKYDKDRTFESRCIGSGCQGTNEVSIYFTNVLLQICTRAHDYPQLHTDQSSHLSVDRQSSFNFNRSPESDLNTIVLVLIATMVYCYKWETSLDA